VRPKGVDAVVVAVWRRDQAGVVHVLLRDGLRPPLTIGRPAETLVVPDRKAYLFFRELVAGIIERDDHGEAGLRARAAIEVHEEAGLTVDPARVELLGAGTFPSPGAMPERFFLTAVQVDGDAVAVTPPGDGSPYEEGATTRWMPLDDAIAACLRGDIEDCKTELALRRLRDRIYLQTIGK
jgi:ADP-ribose pyrophosphatase